MEHRRVGREIGMGAGDVLTRFVEKIVVDPETGCHNWIASCTTDGYGYFKIDGVGWGAHRAAWFLLVGDIPEGQCVLHHCDNIKCVNPDHLFLGSQYDNIQDMVSKGRHKWRSGEDHNRAKLTKKEVEEIRNRYKKGSCSQTELAREYEVSQQLVSRIVVNEIWRE